MNTTEQLVTRVLEGDMKAFEELYNQTNKQVYYACYSFLGNDQDAMDVLQDTYLAGLTHLQSLQNKERFCQWITQIAVNKCKTLLSKKQITYVEDEVLEAVPVEEDDYFLPENYVVNVEKRQLVLNIMSEALTVAQYQTIVLYYFDGMTAQEIADCMGCSVGTVTSRLSAARTKIKLGVQQYEEVSGEKLYSVSGIPFLTALFMAESEGLVIPNVLGNVLGAATGMMQSAMAPMSAQAMQPTTVPTAVEPTQSTTAPATEVMQPMTAPVFQQGYAGAQVVTTKKIASAMLGAAKKRIIMGAVGVALLGGIATIAILANKDDDKKDKRDDSFVAEQDVSETGDNDTGGDEIGSNPSDTSASDLASTEEREQGEAITVPETTEAPNGLSDEPLPLIANYGDENHFAFSSEGKNYVFTATDTVRLFGASGEWDETYENIVLGRALFMVIINGKPITIHDYTLENLNKEIDECEILYQEGDVTLYSFCEEYEDDPEMEIDYFYYLRIKDLVFHVSYYEGNEDGITFDMLWEQLKIFASCIEETDEDVTALALHGNAMSMELIPGYRFAFRPSTTPSWHIRANVEEGNTVYREEGIFSSLYMHLYKDGEYRFVTVDYSKNADNIDHLDYDRNVVDTGLKFGEYTIYEQTSDYLSDRRFFMWIPENEEIITVESWDLDLTPELALEIFELALIPVE